jgi:hypothetical protein
MSISPGGHRLHRVYQLVGDQQVVDELAAAPVDTSETLIFRKDRGQVSQLLPLAPIRSVVAGSADL